MIKLIAGLPQAGLGLKPACCTPQTDLLQAGHGRPVLGLLPTTTSTATSLSQACCRLVCRRPAAGYFFCKGRHPLIAETGYMCCFEHDRHSLAYLMKQDFEEHDTTMACRLCIIIEYSSTRLQLKQNGRPYKAMVRTVSKSRKEPFLKLQKVSSLHYHEFL